MATQSGDTQPILWQIEISHYSEKARWALDLKEIDHVRRAPPAGVHMAIALYLSRGASKTFPILQLEDRAIADSTAIVAALEDFRADPPLYPADPEQRRRALELESFFDEELGPHVRLLAWHELIAEPEMMAEVAALSAPGPMARAKGLAGAYARVFTSVRFGAASDEAAATAREKIVVAIDRLDAELGACGGEYLVGDAFSVADLTAASLLYPLVGPAESPLPRGELDPPALERFRAGLRDRPSFAWVEETYRKHRRAGRPATATTA